MTSVPTSGLSMADLGRRVWEVWHHALREAPDVVVTPAIPILYFGDLDSYLASSLRVITVGLNPSREEFPVEDRFRRFPAGRDQPDLARNGYLNVLNAYFGADPYRAWFSTFEYLLNGLDASYYDGRANTGLHTDLCSPVATDPTWSGLDNATRRLLINSGRPLWHDLVRVLRPHVILISVARRHLTEITFPVLEPTQEIHRLESSRSRPYLVEAWRVALDDESHPLVVFGQAAQRPFGTVSRSDKQVIGQRVMEVVGD